MQFRDLEDGLREVDSEHAGAAARHGLGQDPAAAADVERSCFPGERSGALEYCSRSGLRSCSGLEGPLGSHQLCASAVNLASSAGSALRAAWIA